MAKVEQGPEGSQGLQGRSPKCEFGVVVWGGIAGGRGSQPVLIDVARAGWCGYGRPASTGPSSISALCRRVWLCGRAETGMGWTQTLRWVGP